MRGITGVTGAAPIFREIMLKLHDRYGTSWYQMPEGVRRCWIDPLTGHRVSPEQPRAVEEIYAFPPQPAGTDDYDVADGVRLPAEYRAWVESDQNTLGNLLEGSLSAKHLRILEPASGGFYYLDPDLPAKDQRLVLRAESSGTIEWSSTTLDCRPEGSEMTVGLREGRHEIVAHDMTTGETASTWIEVEPW